MNANARPDGLAPDGRPPHAGAPSWWIYRGTGRPLHDLALADVLPPPPPWRTFDGAPLPENDAPASDSDDREAARRLGTEFNLSESDVDPLEADMVNAALYLRRPLLVTGLPGTGKSSLAYRIARELRLGRVLRWSITSHTTFKSGLYGYDPIGRAQAAGAMQAMARLSPVVEGAVPLVEPPIGEFMRLGPLGTAFLPRRLPRVLLIDELDKSEADLPNDLLGIFEDGEFRIPELERMRDRLPQEAVFTDDPQVRTTIVGGRVQCHAFPMVVITSNGEREFPPAFLRRCLQLQMRSPNADQLAKMVANHLLDPEGEHRHRLIRDFLERSKANGALPADKLFEAVYLATSGAYGDDGDPAWPRLVDALWQRLSSMVP